MRANNTFTSIVRFVLVVLGWGGSALVIITVIPPLSALAAEPIYVDASASGANNGTSWEDAYTSLQDAIGACGADGCEIWLAAGVYTPGTSPTDTFQLSSGIEIYGGFAGTETARDQRDWQAHRSILSGDIDSATAPDNDPDNDGIIASTEDISGTNSYHVVRGADAAVLDGVVITAGNAEGAAEDANGGGMYNASSSPTLRHVFFQGNRASSNGGAIYNSNSSPTLTDVMCSHNSAFRNGGAVYSVGINSKPRFTRVTFTENTVTDPGGGNGGAVYNSNEAAPVLIDVVFTRNRATSRGGGMHNTGSNPTVVNALFRGNVAVSGGGVHNSGGKNLFVNTVFVGNSAVSSFIDYGSGGGMDLSAQGTTTLKNITFGSNSADFYGGALRVGELPTLEVYNSIFWGNSAGQEGNEIYDVGSPSITIDYSIVEGGGWSGTGNTSDPPAFMSVPNDGDDGEWGTPDDDYGNLRLRSDSEGIDAGSNTQLPADTYDLDGDQDTQEALPYDSDNNQRRYDSVSTTDIGEGDVPIVDRGAYEFSISIELDNNTVAENQPAETLVGTFPITASNGEALTYALVPGEGDTDNDHFTIRERQLLTTESFDYEATASHSIRVHGSTPGGGYEERQFTIAVIDVYSAVDDVATTPEERAVAISAASNDEDAATDPATILAVGRPSHGTTELSGTAEILYTPERDFNGTDVFTYTARNSATLTDTGRVTVTVSPVNDAPLLDLNGPAEGIDYLVIFTNLGGTMALVSSDLSIRDVDSTILVSATAAISNPLDAGTERLLVHTGGTAISDAYDDTTAELRLSGSDTITSYQQVMRTLAYANTATTPTTTTRTIHAVVYDSTRGSPLATTLLMSADEASLELHLAVTPDRDTAQPGDKIVFTYHYTNTGVRDARDVVLTTHVPSHTTKVSETNTRSSAAALSTEGWNCPDGSPAGTLCTFQVGTVAGGSGGDVPFAVQVNTSTPAGTTITIGGTVSDDEGSIGELPPSGGDDDGKGVAIIRGSSSESIIYYLPLIKREVFVP